MKAFTRQSWGKWISQILHPSLSEDELNARLKEVRQHLPIPVFWMLGKAQSGKTSIIRVLTGSSLAEIGNGFQACTASAGFYEYPDRQTEFVRFLDTRGLAETDYDPADDMGWCEQQAHLLIVVVKAMDHQQDCVIKAVRKIRKQHPDWPVIVAQTHLHEGYPNRAMEHVMPYPFHQAPFEVAVPNGLSRSLLKQRELFDGLGDHFVPLDFTLEEDGYKPADYGIENLWHTIEETFPLGLLALFRQSEQRHLLNDDYAKKAHPHIIGFAVAAGLAAAIPIPAVSLTTTVAIQAKLFHSIASIYGLTLTVKSVTEVSSAAGMGALAGVGGRELAKLIPVYGQTVALGVAGIYTATVTYALGRVFCLYFAGTLRGHVFSAKMLHALYREEFKRGGAILSRSMEGADT
jgi:uncharacterized protein (DUF697 family)